MTTAKKSEFSISIMLVIGLLAAVGIIYLFVFSMAEDGYGKNMARVNVEDVASLQARIRPVVTIDDIMGGKDTTAVVETVAVVKSPKELYEGVCQACHSTGVAGAPKLGDADAWGARAEVGMEALIATAVAGKGAMPPKGGSAYSEDEIKTVIEFMLREAGLMQAPAEAAVTPMATETEVVEDEIKVMDEVVDEPVVAVSLDESEPSMDLAAGEQGYKAVCFACHDFGVAGAPKLGDVAAWEPRVATGFDALLKSAIDGKGAMPAKGGAAHLSDAEVGNIVAFMLDKVK